MTCLFCSIVEGKIPAKIARTDEHTVAFHDIHPAAPTHVLVIPKKHIASIADANANDTELLGRVLFAAKEVAAELNLVPGGYRVVLNTGKDAGQSVFHLHAHVLAGRTLAWPPG